MTKANLRPRALLVGVVMGTLLCLAVVPLSVAGVNAPSDETWFAVAAQLQALELRAALVTRLPVHEDLDELADLLESLQF